MPTKKIKNVVVLGLGKVGELVAILAQEAGFNVTGVDSVKRAKLPFKTIVGDMSDEKFITQALLKKDAVISCLPYFLNKGVIRLANEKNVHYFDLTEDVFVTEYAQKLAKNSKTVLAPQCGLAPGFIAISGASLTNDFDKIRSIRLRVGALPQNPTGALGYAMNWSADGLVNEYLNDCEVIRDGKTKIVPSLQDLETIVINGLVLEAFSTSGGLGTMCETYAGIDELNYKTMRYPGHMKLMKFFLHELRMRDDRKDASAILLNALPPVNDDVVYLHASVEGWKGKGTNAKLYREEFARTYYPKKIAGKEWRAIAWTTACSIVAVVELVASGVLPAKGFIKQEDINLEDFLGTKIGRYYGK